MLSERKIIKQILFSLLAIVLLLYGCYEFSEGKLTGFIYFAGCVISLAIAEQEKLIKK